ncbi:hypothetical protein DPMN_050722 [Dreissena polymorpha]|uniref:Uncharacterized protein n=1 Tax=Dreissena polymorpha TaxID=45954 RepID=A0A9D4CIF1_DREPO|nr:hypothetical protein DPMN_050722 [Dreissena polymorpha]
MCSQRYHKQNCLTKFHEEINAPPHDDHAFQQIQTISNSSKMKMDNKCVFKSVNKENCPSTGGNNSSKTSFGKHFLPSFVKIEKKVASRVKNAPSPGSHVFQQTGTIFKLIQDP